MYLKPFSKYIASIHTSFGFALLVFSIFHFYNNRKPLFKHITSRGGTVFMKLQGMFIIVFLLSVSALMYLNFPHINSLYDIGNAYRNKQIGKEEKELNYELISLTPSNTYWDINIEMKKGESFSYPLIAIWLEDTSGNYLETVYVSKTIGSGTYTMSKVAGYRWLPGQIRRPEALPRWAHQRGIIAEDGLYIPMHESPDLDGVTGPTPINSFLIESGSKISALTDFNIFLEVNQSYDWNEYYTDTSFPDDTVYSGSGSVGQPALVYSATVSTRGMEKHKYYFMKPLGHSHYSGKDGALYTNLDSLTTALDIIDRLIVSVKPKEE